MESSEGASVAEDLTRNGVDEGGDMKIGSSGHGWPGRKESEMEDIFWVR